MLLEAGAQLRIGRLLDHVGQRLRDLVFGVIEILQTMHEEVIHGLDVFGEKAHRSSLLGNLELFVGLKRTFGL